jgi:DNA-directed RNA polymerase subunit RPC12/RpoP
MNCPNCSHKMKVHPTLTGFDVAFYVCAACGKTFSKAADTLLDVLSTFAIQTGKFEEVDEKGKPIVIQKRRKEDWEPKKDEREFICSISCPRGDCGARAKVYKGDQRSGAWLRAECADGHWGDLGPDSILLPEDVRQALKGKS